MQKNSNRRGLALGAIIALFGSLFVSAPAQAATLNADIGIYPVAENGTTSSAFVGTLADDFPVVVQGKGSFAIAGSTNLSFKIEKTAGTNMDLAYSVSGSALDLSSVTASSPVQSRSGVIVAGSTSASVSAVVNGSVAHINFKASSASGVASWSPVTFKLTVWRDNQGGVANDRIDSDEPYSEQVITLLHPKDLTRTLTLTALAPMDTFATASATITGVNLANLSGTFTLRYSASAGLAATDGQARTAPEVHVLGGVLSQSAGVASASFSGSEVVSVGLYYAGIQVGASVSQTVTASSIDNIYVSVASSDHVTSSAIANSASGQTVTVRPNQTYTVRVVAHSNSKSVSGAVVSVAMTGPGLGAASNSSLIVNGGAATTSYPTALSLTTGANGVATFTFATTGVTVGGVNFTIVASQGNLTTTALQLDPVAADYSIANEFDRYATTPGTAVTLNFDVEDQWQVASTRADQRIKVTRGGTGFAYAETISYVAVTAGKAAFSFTPSPATKTGSATVDTALEQYDANEFTWKAVSGVSGDRVTVAVSSEAQTFTASAAIVSQSASISYSISDGVYIWTGPVTVSTTVAGADVLVTATGLVIGYGSKTASDTVTVRSDANGAVVVKFAGNRTGKYTVSYAVGAAVTSSLIVIDVPVSSSGKAISYDKTQILAGETSTITGTLVDMFGNAVPAATVYVGWSGKGLPFGANTVATTDADGEFSFQVLALSTELGAGKITATYRPAGAVTDTKNLTFVADVSIVASVAAPATDQKLTVGSFKGFVAIYALNYTGQKLSAKVAGKWLTVNNLSRFQRVVRNTGAAIPIVVDLYIDGKLVRTENIVTK
jgi:hypothetical protein